MRVSKLGSLAGSAILAGGLTLALGLEASALAQPAKPAPAPAPAQPAPASPDDKKATAKEAFEEGNKKFEAGDFMAAYAAFKKADEAVPGAVPKYRMAESLDRAGDAAGAQKAYQAFLGSNPPKDKHKERIDNAKARIEIIKKAPPKFFLAESLERNGDIKGAMTAYQEYLDSKPPKDRQKEQIDTATSHLDALKKTPADVKVTVTPPTATLAVDGAAQTANPLKVAPGKHVVSAKADGFVDGTSDVDVGPGEKKEITITLQAKPAEVASTPTAPTAPTAPTKPAEKPEEHKKPSKIPAIITLSLAGAGAVVGGVFGGLALKSKGDFNNTPTQDLYDQTERDALIADMSFGVAITFGVTGVVLLVTSNTEEAPEKKASSGVHFGGAPWATPHGGGFAGVVTF